MSFNTRQIIYQCKCGKVEIFNESFLFSEPLPINTTPYLTYKDIEDIKNTFNTTQN